MFLFSFPFTCRREMISSLLLYLSYIFIFFHTSICLSCPFFPLCTIKLFDDTLVVICSDWDELNLLKEFLKIFILVSWCCWGTDGGKLSLSSNIMLEVLCGNTFGELGTQKEPWWWIYVLCIDIATSFQLFILSVFDESRCWAVFERLRCVRNTVRWNRSEWRK